MPLDPYVLIAGVKIWSDNPILTLFARGPSKFGFSFRDGFERVRSGVLPLHLHEVIYRRHVVVEVRQRIFIAEPENGTADNPLPQSRGYH